MSTTPDITEDLGNGLVRTTRIDSIQIDRNGDPAKGGWRTQLAISKVTTLPDGSVVSQQAPGIANNFADLAHDPRVLQVFALLREVCLDIVTGNLAPLPPATEPAIEPSNSP